MKEFVYQDKWGQPYAAANLIGMGARASRPAS